MANEAYRAVFLRVHPTGKMVLSLTTEADGNEPGYAELVATELGVPPHPLGGPQPAFCDLEEHNALTAHQERQRLERSRQSDEEVEHGR